MFNYLRGEIYRILHKKSLYIYFVALALGYILLSFVIMGDKSAAALEERAGIILNFLSPVAGGYLFAALYTDDLNSKNLSTLIGFGVGKAKIIFSKLILMLLFSGVFFAIVPLFMYAISAIFGASLFGTILGSVYTAALGTFLQVFAFAALSAIVVYGLQRPTFSMVLYILLTSVLISQILSMILNMKLIKDVIPGISDHLMMGIVQRLTAGILTNGPIEAPIIEYVVYVAVAVIISILAFRKKELEF
jgi:ABC-type transport system involved in multi-copper enzyme maturation permease subunit